MTCPTLKRLRDRELILLFETKDKPQNHPLVKEWEEVLARIRRLYQGELEEPSWFQPKPRL